MTSLILFLFFLLGPPVKDVVAVAGTNIVVPGIAGEELLLRRNLAHGIERTLSLWHPDFLHLTVFHEDAKLRGLCIVQSDERTVGLVNGVIDNEYVFLGLRLVNSPLFEKGEHLLGRYLIEALPVIQFLHGKGIVDDVGMVDDGVLHKHLNLVADKLLAVVPNDGVAVHGHTGVDTHVSCGRQSQC